MDGVRRMNGGLKVSLSTLLIASWSVSLCLGGCSLVVGDPAVARNSAGSGPGASGLSGSGQSGSGYTGAGQGGVAGASMHFGGNTVAGRDATAGATDRGETSGVAAAGAGATGAPAGTMGSGATAGFNAGNATSGAPAGTAANGATAGMNGAAVGGGNVPIYGGSSGITGVGIAGIGAATTLGGRSSSGGGNLGIAGVTTTAAGAGNAGAQACPGTGGPTMVMLPQGYCIDSTEVTRAQYGAWLSSTTAATINAQDIATCSWNTSFVPHEGCMAGSYVCQGSGCGNHPQVCVDWCDAVAFCKGVGKRLCGKIGGGPNAYDASQWATASQLYQACSSGGKYKYPYGDNDAQIACNIIDYGEPNHVYMTMPVGTLTDCQAPVPYAGVFDLAGNVNEWEDACETTARPELDNCRRVGGSYWTTSSACTAFGNLSRSYETDSVGFRCCSQ